MVVALSVFVVAAAVVVVVVMVVVLLAMVLMAGPVLDGPSVGEPPVGVVIAKDSIADRPASLKLGVGAVLVAPPSLLYVERRSELRWNRGREKREG